MDLAGTPQLNMPDLMDAIEAIITGLDTTRWQREASPTTLERFRLAEHPFTNATEGPEGHLLFHVHPMGRAHAGSRRGGDGGLYTSSFRIVLRYIVRIDSQQADFRLGLRALDQIRAACLNDSAYPHGVASYEVSSLDEPELDPAAMAVLYSFQLSLLHRSQ